MTADALNELATRAVAPVHVPGWTAGSGTLADLRVWAESVRTRPESDPADGSGPYAPFASARMLVVGLSPFDPVTDDGTGEPIRVAAVVEDDDPAMQLEGAAQAGADAVDALVDEGADLILLVTGCRAEDLRAALALVSVFCRIEPAKLLDYAGLRDDHRWMADLAGLRDARRAAVRHRASPAFAAEALGRPALLSAAGALLQAAVRRTPVLLDGAVALAGAMVAGALSTGVARWCVTAPTGALHEAPVLQRLGLVTAPPLAAGGPPGASAILQFHALQMALHIGRDQPDPTIPLTATDVSLDDEPKPTPLEGP